MHKVKIRSDKYFEYKKDQAESMKDMPKEMQGGMCEYEPVDLYGKRVNLDQNDPHNLEETAEDIQSVYGLKPSSNEESQKTKQGGMAHETHDMEN